MFVPIFWIVYPIALKFKDRKALMTQIVITFALVMTCRLFPTAVQASCLHSGSAPHTPTSPPPVLHKSCIAL